MEKVLEFFGQLLPYLLFIPVGLWVSKKDWIPKSYVTTPLIYVLMPVLVINHVLEAEEQTILVLPVMAFLLAVSMNIPAWIAHKTFAKEENPFLLSSSFSFFNVAFFGIPTVMALYGQQGVTTLITIYIGTAFYGDIIGYYQISRSKNGMKESFKKTLQVPFLYAFIIAVVLRLIDFEAPDEVEPVADVFSHIVSAAGMMIIGMNVSDIRFKGIDWNYLTKFMALRSVFAIGIMVAIMAGEFFLVDMLGDEEREFLALIPLFPIAANVTVFASFLGSKEKESGLLILCSMGLSLILIPIVIQFFD
jgi:malate permease and related proteins